MVLGPTIASTFSSDVSFRPFNTAPVGVEPSSSTMYSMVLPAISFGHIWTTFLLGMSIDAAGPVVARSTPILICALATPVDSDQPTEATAANRRKRVRASRGCCMRFSGKKL